MVCIQSPKQMLVRGALGGFTKYFSSHMSRYSSMYLSPDLSLEWNRNSWKARNLRVYAHILSSGWSMTSRSLNWVFLRELVSIDQFPCLILCMVRTASFCAWCVCTAMTLTVKLPHFGATLPPQAMEVKVVF